ncbi:aldo/keto reductase [Hoeflea prorocentri]|uniref:Aldo/keto reductase n=1 Tax=Hoeflea prorocentri TaxID=1922333 RepID=A0A9X3UIV6_9HYPH|nr:aldo/keto reductase [Hoeflea prorocentri]MCY6379461.1 aldo/keto reductase [Hoeflea prorocentri]MDA5397261.1 aldo/keto reductase [Hoeflea prorocentri]
MHYNELGRTGIMVSDICLGSMTWGSQNSEQEAHEQLDYAVGEGVNFIDTAEMYPTTPRLKETTGRTEEHIGTWLEIRADRDDLVIATKITGEGNKDVRDGKRVTGQMVREALEDSLKRLRTDYVDLYQLHWPNRGSYHFRKYWTFDATGQSPEDMDQEVADILGEVGRLRDEGKMRAFGLSNESAWGVMKFLEVSRKHDLPRVASVQNEYSLICRLFDLDMAEVSVHEDVGLMAFSPLAAGALSGKYLDGDIPEGSRRSMQPNLNGRYVENSERVIKRYADIAGRHGLNLAQMSLAFCRIRPFMMSTIIGATSMEQLKTDIAAKDVTLSDEVLADIQAVYREDPMPM